MRCIRRPHEQGQALVELALVLPLFLMVLVGIVSLGIGVFFQQQVTNAAREAARYASIHSATARCTVDSELPPTSPPLTYVPCPHGWDDMVAAGRHLVFGIHPQDVQIVACWSGYRLKDLSGNPTGSYDAPPPNTYDVLGTIDSGWAACSIDGEDPSVAHNLIGCSSTLRTTIVDQASSISEAPGRVVANQVTAYACYDWHPPMAGFLLIPETVTLRGVISEPMERQQ